MPNYINDDYMTYDLQHHRYVLTQQALMDNRGITLIDYFSESDNPEMDIEIFLKRCSLELYSFIYKFNIRTRDLKEYILSLPENRDGIQEALEEFVYAIVKNGTDPNLYFKRDDLNTPVAVAYRGIVKTQYVPDSVRMILDSYELTYSGNYLPGTYPHDYKKLRGTDY